MIAALGLVKLSVLFFYRSLFVVQRRTAFDILSLASIVIVVLWTLGFILAFAFNCKLNFSAAWGSQYDLMTHCNVGFGGEQALVISDFLTDLFVLCLPFPAVSVTY